MANNYPAVTNKFFAVRAPPVRVPRSTCSRHFPMCARPAIHLSPAFGLGRKLYFNAIFFLFQARSHAAFLLGGEARGSIKVDVRYIH